MLRGAPIYRDRGLLGRISEICDTKMRLCAILCDQSAGGFFLQPFYLLLCKTYSGCIKKIAKKIAHKFNFVSQIHPSFVEAETIQRINRKEGELACVLR